MDLRQLVNRKNSRAWVKANESNNSDLYRNAFVQKYGGMFERMGGVWVWRDKVANKVADPTKLWIFHKSDGMTYMVQNFMDFCRIHDLSKSAMYELMNGKRKSHKGFVKVEKLI
jgi:hypothetical protein